MFTHAVIRQPHPLQKGNSRYVSIKLPKGKLNNELATMALTILSRVLSKSIKIELSTRGTR